MPIAGGGSGTPIEATGITVAEMLTVIEDRCGALLAQARAATGDAEKPSLNACLSWAVRALGRSTASMLEATNAEVQGVASTDALIDVAELRTLESILTNLNQVNLTTGPVKEDLSDLAERLAGEILPVKRKQVAMAWGKLLAIPIESDRTLRKAKLAAV